MTSIHQLTRVLPFGIDRVLLDNMSLETLREAVRRVREYGDRAPVTEASWNITLGTVRSVAETGVDYISTGALTKDVTAIDLSMRFSL